MSRNWAPRAGFTEDLLEATVGLMLAAVGLMLATVGLILAAVGLDSGDPRRPRPESAGA